jgi:fatty acid desaturase
MSTSHKYADYKDINQKQLEIDIDKIKEELETPNIKDFKHLKKLEMWGDISLVLGFALMITLMYSDYNMLINIILLIGSSFLISVSNVSIWANVAHPILHGAYDKIEGIPEKYKKKNFAKGNRRWFDWFDWIKPEAWAYEHNIMHHYHLGEADDPDNVEKNMVWLHKAKIPMWLKYTFVYVFAATWKFTYYAPNTLRILGNKEKIANKEEPTMDYEMSPFSKNGKTLWLEYYLPYGIFKFILMPSIFLVFGTDIALIALYVMILSELFANLHSFLVIVPNHSAEDIYQFSTPHKNQGEYYLRQIMGSVNYNTGTDLIDFGHGFLNYQIEHHLFPNMPHSFYQKMQPKVKEICKKHNLEYRQDSVFKRFFMSVDLMVGKTKVLRVEGI